MAVDALTALYGTEYEVGAASEILCKSYDPFYKLHSWTEHLNMFWTVKSDGNLIIFTTDQRSCGKKMFSVLSVCLFRGVVV